MFQSQKIIKGYHGIFLFLKTEQVFIIKKKTNPQSQWMAVNVITFISWKDIGLKTYKNYRLISWYQDALLFCIWLIGGTRIITFGTQIKANAIIVEKTCIMFYWKFTVIRDGIFVFILTLWIRTSSSKFTLKKIQKSYLHFKSVTDRSDFFFWVSLL